MLLEVEKMSKVDQNERTKLPGENARYQHRCDDGTECGKDWIWKPSQCGELQPPCVIGMQRHDANAMDWQ